MAVGYASFTSLYNYTPTQTDEVELRVGDIILVKKPVDPNLLEKWLEGKNQRTQQYGQIPGTYLREIAEFPETFTWNDHNFQKLTRVFPTCCSRCKDYIWGKNNKLYQCFSCNKSFHLICAKQKIEQCSTAGQDESDESPYDTLAKSPSEWSVEDVISWMAATNLFQYANTFRQCNINGEMLVNFDETRLENLGIIDSFHKKMILVCIGELIGNSETRKNRKYPGMKTGEEGSIHTHSFLLQTFTTVTWCHECGHILFGLVRQGLQCKKCELIVHRKCTNDRTLRICPQKRILEPTTDPVYPPLLENGSIPDIVKKCVGVVESRGLGTRGIYRIQPDNSASKYNLRRNLYKDAEDVDMKDEEWINPLYPSSVLFSYLNELPEPILPCSIYEELLAITAKPNSAQLNLDHVLDKIPEVNIMVLNYIFEHLNRVAASENQMTVKDVGDIFGLILLRPSQENLMKMAANIRTHSEVVRLLLARSNKISVINNRLDVDEGDDEEETDVNSPPVPPRQRSNAGCVDDSFKSTEYPEWYHGAINSNEVQKKMADCNDGSFLVRDSHRTPGEFTLCVRKNEGNKLIKILHHDGGYGLAVHDTMFESVPAIIEYYRTHSLKQHNENLDIMLLYPIPCEAQIGVSAVKKATKVLKIVGQRFNDKSLRYEQLSEDMLKCDQDISSLDEAIYAQRELLSFLEEQVKIHQNFQREAPTSDKEKLVVNYGFVADRLGEENRNLSILEDSLHGKTNDRRQLESDINRIKPDLWELRHTKEKYMRFLEENDLKEEEVSLLAGNTDFTIYEMPMTAEDESIDLSEENWLFGTLDRDTVREYLQNTEDGTFLIRDSNQNRGVKVISIMFNGNIKHCVIEEGPEGYGFAEGFTTYKTLLSLVQYYHRVSLQMHNKGLATTLRLPVRCNKGNNIPPYRK